MLGAEGHASRERLPLNQRLAPWPRTYPKTETRCLGIGQEHAAGTLSPWVRQRSYIASRIWEDEGFSLAFPALAYLPAPAPNSRNGSEAVMETSVRFQASDGEVHVRFSPSSPLKNAAFRSG